MFPLEISRENYINSEEETLLTVDNDAKLQTTTVFQSQVVPPKQINTVKRKSVCGSFLFILHMIKWHLLLFCCLTSAFCATFHFCLKKKDKEEIFTALSFLDDWRQLVFFFGVYVSYSVKKVGDVSGVSHLNIVKAFLNNPKLLQSIPITDKMANLISFSVKTPVISTSC